VSLAVAGARACDVARDARSGWVGLAHDRNGHYAFAQQLARDARGARPDRFLATLDLSKTWPPLHGMLAAVVLTITGLDYRAAMVPSLLAWILLATVTFLLARDLAIEAGAGAGVLAASFVIASPAYARFSVDVMLESLGAALTTVVAWLYVRARREAAPARWRALAIALTLLFFEKYNYWAIAVAGLVVVEAARWWSAGRDRSLQAWRRLRGTHGLVPLIFDWRSAVVAAAILAPIAVWLVHPEPIDIAGRRVSLYPPNNLITAAWAALVWRVAVEWKARSLQIDGVFGPAGAALVRWHALPIAASFLFPRRLSGFVSQLVNLDPGQGLRLMDTVAYYARAAAFDYHAGWIGQSVAVVLAGALAIAVSRRQRDAVGAVLTLWIVGAIAMLVHPHWPASRFLHSYFALGWVRIYLGNFDEAIDSLLRCLRLSPNDQQAGGFLGHLALAQYHRGQYEEAVRDIERARRRRRIPFLMRTLLATLGQLGRTEEAAIVVIGLSLLD